MINREWHAANRMPKNPTLNQRLDWHVGHAANCDCREMPASIREAIAKREAESK